MLFEMQRVWQCMGSKDVGHGLGGWDEFNSIQFNLIQFNSSIQVRLIASPAVGTGTQMAEHANTAAWKMSERFTGRERRPSKTRQNCEHAGCSTRAWFVHGGHCRVMISTSCKECGGRSMCAHGRRSASTCNSCKAGYVLESRC